MKVVRLSALSTGRLCLKEIFLVLISVRGWVDPSASGRIMSMKNSSDTIGNRTRDLPACSVVPQPTALPCVPNSAIYYSTKQTPAQYTIPNVTLWLNVIYSLFSIHPCTALQLLLGSGLAQKAPPFFSILSSSPFSYSEDPQCITLDDVLPSFSWFSYRNYVDALF